jgi:hypothetical protein
MSFKEFPSFIGRHAVEKKPWNVSRQLKPSIPNSTRVKLTFFEFLYFGVAGASKLPIGWRY